MSLAWQGVRSGTYPVTTKTRLDVSSTAGAMPDIQIPALPPPSTVMSRDCGDGAPGAACMAWMLVTPTPVVLLTVISRPLRRTVRYHERDSNDVSGGLRVVEVVAVATKRQDQTVSQLHDARALEYCPGNEVTGEIVVGWLVLNDIRPARNICQRRKCYGIDLILT